MSDSPNPEKSPVAAEKQPLSAGSVVSQYQFAKNPIMNRTWMRNLLFGLGIAMPLSLFGAATNMWQAKDLLFIYGIVVVTCFFLLPLYTAIVRELP